MTYRISLPCVLPSVNRALARANAFKNMDYVMSLGMSQAKSLRSKFERAHTVETKKKGIVREMLSGDS
jgi:hypothetical protein